MSEIEIAFANYLWSEAMFRRFLELPIFVEKLAENNKNNKYFLLFSTNIEHSCSKKKMAEYRL